MASRSIDINQCIYLSLVISFISSSFSWPVFFFQINLQTRVFCFDLQWAINKSYQGFDQKPFTNAGKKLGSGKDGVESMKRLAFLWKDHLKDPSWHPFKVISAGEKCEVWKYQKTERDSDGALEHAYVNTQTSAGLTKSEVLLTASLNNMLRLMAHWKEKLRLS